MSQGISSVDLDARAAALEAARRAKMARSAHAFVRGNTADHYRWMAELGISLPEGPPVWICGDCHIGNLGPLADADGRIDIQIRDLDQTVIGNPAHDLVRLSLSLASAARGSDLPGMTTARMLHEVMRGYEAGVAELDDPARQPEEPNVVALVRREAIGRKWRHLARERLTDVKPSIPLGSKFWALSDDERWNIGLLLDTPHVKRFILSLSAKSTQVELVDSAYWMKGCSSLGLLRYAALVHVSGDRRSKLSLIDIKEAVPSVAPASGGVMPAQAGERVVAGARALAPNLGERMAAGELLGKPVFVRELLPADLKLEIEQFSRAEAIKAARYLSSVVGKAHGRQMAPDDRAAWITSLQKASATRAGQPSWLWTAVVALLIKHEEAYLEHCRAAAALDAV